MVKYKINVNVNSGVGESSIFKQNLLGASIIIDIQLWILCCVEINFLKLIIEAGVQTNGQTSSTMFPNCQIGGQITATGISYFFYFIISF